MMCNGLFHIADALSCPETRHSLSQKVFCFDSSPPPGFFEFPITFFGVGININWMSNALSDFRQNIGTQGVQELFFV